MDRGQLVPDDVTVAMILDGSASPTPPHGVILDGFPRTRAQAEALDEMLAGARQAVDGALYIDVRPRSSSAGWPAAGSAAPAATSTTHVSHPPQVPASATSTARR